MPWDAIIGHDWAVRLLHSEVQSGRIGHAYLIAGPAQVGKTTLALCFAQALNCTAPLAERPCGVCRSCILIEAGRHPDVRQVSGEMGTRGRSMIKIDQIRDLQHDLSLTPTEGRYRLAILQQFDRANPSAANAFLKTLEEPPVHTIIILTADRVEELLPTVLSRCRQVILRPLSLAATESALRERWKLEEGQARVLAHLCGGRLGWAVHAMSNPAIREERHHHVEMLLSLFREGFVARFGRADSLSRKPEDLRPILETWLSFWRDLMLVSSSEPDAGAIMANLDFQDAAVEACQEFSGKTITTALRATENTLWLLERNVNARLSLENLFLQYPKI